MKKYKYRIGQVVKFYTTLHKDEGEWKTCKITNAFYSDEDDCIRYKMEEYPQKTEFVWDVPESQLSSVTLMEM